MTQPIAKKSTGNSDPKPPAKRAGKSARRDADPTAKEMAMAARQLKWTLDWIVNILDEANERGKTDAEAWARIWLKERKPNRKSLDAEHGAIQAIRVFAERSVIDHRRLFRALRLSAIAKDLLAGTLSAGDAWREATTAREDTLLDESETIDSLNAAIDSTRKPERRWQKVYNVLAWDADVWPRPDTTGQLRPDLKMLYQTDWQGTLPKCD